MNLGGTLSVRYLLKKLADAIFQFCVEVARGEHPYVLGTEGLPMALFHLRDGDRHQIFSGGELARGHFIAEQGVFCQL